MTLKEIKTRFQIGEHKHEGKYIVYHPTKHGQRMVDLFLCLLNKEGKKFFVDGQKPTGNLDELEKQIYDHVNSLPYDSEYYYPNLRKGLFETYIIHDYLRSLGFKNPKYSHSNELYVLEDKNIYNYTSQKITISILGLDIWGSGNDTLKGILVEEVKVQLHTGELGWMEIKVKRNVEDIKKGIDSIIKPLLVSDSVYNIQKAEEFKNAGEVEIFMKQITQSLSTVSVDYKATLKEKLLEMAEKL